MRPYVIIKCAVSADGYLDDLGRERLKLSSPEDFDRVDAVRATSDAILIGAQTLRRDNPRLTVKSHSRISARLKKGKSDQLIRAVITGSGRIDPNAKFFNKNGGKPLVYCPKAVSKKLTRRIGSLAAVIVAGSKVVPVKAVLRDLTGRGVKRLLVENGGSIASELIKASLFDEIQLSIAPFFVSDRRAPRFINAPGNYPFNKMNRLKLMSVDALGDTALLTWLREK